MLNDGVALIARHHSDEKEPAILRIRHRLEEVVAAIAIVLGRLHNCDLRICKSWDEIAQPIRLNLIVAVDYCNDFRIGGHMLERIVQRARFETRQWIEVNKLES